ncbi:MAG TPA: nicotinate-nucleotide--dimethylbenzimidazole phosphoribosyltransferase [Candidatus Sulfotelmatobacter sp.]|nr:nicotinate-nucleotide--dimethylbenzimidazole phosphoribosyltransferase [Candidatus Sulfotelmatobacter sp.]
MTLQAWRGAIAAPDPALAAAARERIDNLTKPLGSLGEIEELGVQLCAIAGAVPPPHAFERRAVLVGAGDHGVAIEGVSAYPPEVTPQMVGGFLAEIAAINAFARAVRAEVYVADFGVRTPFAAHPRLIEVRCGPGTANLAHEPAIGYDAVARVLDAGAAAFAALRERAAFDVLALGEMGIANTTAAAAIVAACTGAPVAQVVGRGTGIDDARLAVKRAVVERALARVDTTDVVSIAAELGGFEIVGLAGVILSAARARIPVVLDGFIVSAAALLAQRIAPNALAYCIAAHRSQEPGHAIALAALRLEPLLDLRLRLGEGSGAALALPLVEAAARMVREMKTFAEAGVAEKESEA